MCVKHGQFRLDKFLKRDTSEIWTEKTHEIYFSYCCFTSTKRTLRDTWYCISIHRWLISITNSFEPLTHHSSCPDSESSRQFIWDFIIVFLILVYWFSILIIFNSKSIFMTFNCEMLTRNAFQHPTKVSSTKQKLWEITEISQHGIYRNV